MALITQKQQWYLVSTDRSNDSIQILADRLAGTNRSVNLLDTYFYWFGYKNSNFKIISKFKHENNSSDHAILNLATKEKLVQLKIIVEELDKFCGHELNVLSFLDDINPIVS